MKKTIQRQLAALPPKVALPLTQLVKIGQLREQDLRTVLDAGDLTGNHQTLVGFAAGAMGMKAQGVADCRYCFHGEKAWRPNPTGLDPSPLARGT